MSASSRVTRRQLRPNASGSASRVKAGFRKSFPKSMEKPSIRNSYPMPQRKRILILRLIVVLRSIDRRCTSVYPLTITSVITNRNAKNESQSLHCWNRGKGCFFVDSKSEKSFEAHSNSRLPPVPTICRDVFRVGVLNGRLCRVLTANQGGSTGQDSSIN